MTKAKIMEIVLVVQSVEDGSTVSAQGYRKDGLGIRPSTVVNTVWSVMWRRAKSKE